MTEEEFKKLKEKGEIEEIKEEERLEPVEIPVERVSLDDFLTFLEILRQIKRHRITTPTHKPKSFLEQIEFAKIGTEYRLYLYIDGGWKYVILT